MCGQSCCVEFAMVHIHSSSGRRARRRHRGNRLLTAALVAISLSPMAYFADLHVPDDATPVASVGPAATPAPVQETVVAASPLTYDPSLVDPMPALSGEALDFVHNAPLAAAFSPLPVQRDARLEPPAPAALPEPSPAAQPTPAVTVVAQAVQPVPLPVPRPVEVRAPRLPEAPRMASAVPSMPLKSAAPASAPSDNRSFFEKLFGVRPASPPEAALSYAALDSGNVAPSSRFNPAPAAGEGTAVYDISAQVVYMPNGEKLEAHSGLGDKLDDPRYVHVRMRGPTPPGTYVLTEREQLFHGVRALRMNPVGGSAAIYGRDGILAHTYMLGPNGDSNGCVSFRNYDRFLQAYLKGEVKRLVVVAGRGQDLLPRMVNSRRGVVQRSDRAI